MHSDCRVAFEAERRSPAERFPALKRQGCNLLVTGDVSTRTANRASRRLLGDPALERTRVVVRTDDSDVADLLPPTVDRDASGVTVVDCAASRPAVSPASATSVDDADAEADPLVALDSTVVETVDEFRATARRRIGGEFRLSVTSLDRLLFNYSPDAVERFLRRTTEAVASVRGLGHYRYAGPRSELSALPLDRLFDGFVELRDRPDAAQRISCPQAGPTNWVEL